MRKYSKKTHLSLLSLLQHRNLDIHSWHMQLRHYACAVTLLGLSSYATMLMQLRHYAYTAPPLGVCSYATMRMKLRPLAYAVTSLMHMQLRHYAYATTSFGVYNYATMRMQLRLLAYAVTPLFLCRSHQKTHYCRNVAFVHLF